MSDQNDPNSLNEPGRPFSVDQDRTIDPITASFFCTSCPFKSVKTNVRNPSSNGISNPREWNAEAAGQQAPTMHIQYVCSSENFKPAQRMFIQQSSTMGVGWCPFLQQKMDLLQGGEYGDGG